MCVAWEWELRFLLHRAEKILPSGRTYSVMNMGTELNNLESLNKKDEDFSYILSPSHDASISF
jgi:hypothetical protein